MAAADKIDGRQKNKGEGQTEGLVIRVLFFRPPVMITRGNAVKHFKILLQLHSIKLILSSALAIAFLAGTATDSWNKTETTQAGPAIANEEANSLAGAHSVPTKTKWGSNK